MNESESRQGLITETPSTLTLPISVASSRIITDDDIEEDKVAIVINSDPLFTNHHSKKSLNGSSLSPKKENLSPMFVIGDNDDDNNILSPPSLSLPSPEVPKISKTRPSFAAGWQIFFAVAVAACGNFIAGLILDLSKSWTVFVYTPELYYLVPILLSLKGNLEMTMVARLSTLANLGTLNNCKKIFQVLRFNICLVQTQAIVVSFLASFVTLIALSMEDQSSQDHSIILNDPLIFPTDSVVNCSLVDPDLLNYGNNTSKTRKVLLIFATSITTANVACLVSTVSMIMFTVALSYLKINPDNFVTALAASFGDIITSFLIGIFGQYINNYIAKSPDPNGTLCPSVNYYDDLYSPWLAINLIIAFILAAPFLMYLTCQDDSTREILFGLDAWIPILLSMMIAFVSGLVLRFGAVEFNFMSLFQPLINGVGGNLAAITTSRHSTELHLESRSTNLRSNKKETIKEVIKRTFNSFLTFKNHKNKMIIVFIMMAITVHLFYGILAPIVHRSDHHQITWLFYVFYIPATVMQVLLLLILTRFFVEIVWCMNFDPDTSAIPILTSLGDILGTVFLFIAFLILRSIGDISANPPLAATTPNKDFDWTNQNFTIFRQSNLTNSEFINIPIDSTESLTSSLIATSSTPGVSVTTTNNLATFLFISYVLSTVMPSRSF